MKQSLTVLLFFTSLFLLHAQGAKESTNVDFIKSIHFVSSDIQQQFPILSGNETFTLSFDDLLAQDNDYYFRIKHFNRDWTPSDLFQNQFINGFDNQRINNFRSSFGTLQRYNNYRLTLPNENIQFLASGNYMIEVYDADDQMVFSRKFLVLDKKSELQAGVFPSQDVGKIRTHHNLQFSITPIGFQIRNPNRDIAVFVMQNSQWEEGFFAPPPQYTSGNRLLYRYAEKTLFAGGNEFFHFDTKDIAAITPRIGLVNRGLVYEHYLYPSLPRTSLPYSYAPDINGNFQINTLQGNDASIEADYSQVYFRLNQAYELEDEEIYIYGKFNNYELSEENKMFYNPSIEAYEGLLLLKQGFYNYKFVVKKKGQVELNAISGSFSATENKYTFLVYHRGIGDLYDALIGATEIQSFDLER